MAFCRVCGLSLSESAPFCPTCGTPVLTDSAPPAEAPPAWTAADSPPLEDWSAPQSPDASPAPRQPAFSGTAASIAFAAAAVAAVFALLAGGTAGGPMSTLFSFNLGTLVMACILWLAMKVTRVGGTFLAMVVVAIAGDLASRVAGDIVAVVVANLVLIWAVSLVAPVVVMVEVIVRLTDAEVWPDAVLMVLVAYLIMSLATFLL